MGTEAQSPGGGSETRKVHALQAVYLHKIAVRAVNLSDDDCGIIAITFAMASVEAMVNEALFLISEADPDSLPAKVRSFASAIALAQGEISKDTNWRIKDKIRALGIALGGEKGVFGREPFQGLSLLIDARNAIMHSKPDVSIVTFVLGEGASFTENELIESICTRANVERPDARFPTQLVKLLSLRQVGVWAVGVSRATIVAMKPWFDPPQLQGSFADQRRWYD